MIAVYVNLYSGVPRLAVCSPSWHPFEGIRPEAFRCATGILRVDRGARNFLRKTDATRFAHAVETDKVRGDWLDPRLGRVTFGEWAEEWLDHLDHLKPKTRLDYEVSLRRHVMPLLAEAKIAAVDRATMRRLASEMTVNGAGPHVVRIAMHVARRVFDVALEAGAIKANPASGVRLPRPTKTEMLFLTRYKSRRWLSRSRPRTAP